MVPHRGHVINLGLNDVLGPDPLEHVVQLLGEILVVALVPDGGRGVGVHLGGFVYNLHQGGGQQVPARHLLPHLEHGVERGGPRR
jgi:hypothetical protein